MATNNATNTSDPITVSQGGTGATSLTGLVKGNGTGAFTAVTAPSGTVVGTSDTQTLSAKTFSDFLQLQGSASAPSTPSTGLGKIVLAGTSSVRPRFINESGTLETVQTSHASYNPYKFRARRTTAQNTGTGAFAAVQFNTEDFDTNSNFDTATNVGRYTAPVAGFYQFNWHVGITTNTSIFIVSLFKNGSEYSRGDDSRDNATLGAGGSDLIQLAAGDYVDIRAYGASAVAIDTTNTYFSGFLVSTL